MISRPDLAAAALLAIVAAFTPDAAGAQASPQGAETVAPRAAATDAVQFPTGSRLGLAPPTGMVSSKTFPGFEDVAVSAYIRLIALPEPAFAEIEKTMSAEALKSQGMILEKQERIALTGGRALFVSVRQDAGGVPIRKRLLIAPMPGLTALISFEAPQAAKEYPDAAVRTALASLASRSTVPADEQLQLVPFKVGELAGLRVAGVVPGRALQLTDGDKDVIDSIDQAHMIIGAAAGQTPSANERDSFARSTFGTLPNVKDLRITGSESMRVGGQQGHEMRAVAKDAKTGAEVEIVQWLRFGSGAYLRILGFAPREKWAEAFPKFRAVRDGLEPR